MTAAAQMSSRTSQPVRCAPVTCGWIFIHMPFWTRMGSGPMAQTAAASFSEALQVWMPSRAQTRTNAAQLINPITCDPATNALSGSPGFFRQIWGNARYLSWNNIPMNSQSVKLPKNPAARMASTTRVQFIGCAFRAGRHGRRRRPVCGVASCNLLPERSFAAGQKRTLPLAPALHVRGFPMPLMILQAGPDFAQQEETRLVGRNVQVVGDAAAFGARGAHQRAQFLLQRGFQPGPRSQSDDQRDAAS